MSHLNSKAFAYIKEVIPVICGLALAALAVYQIYGCWLMVKVAFMDSVLCKIRIKNNDDTFIWLQKYMQDKGIIKEDTQLKAGLKLKAKEDWWVSIKTDMFKTKNEKEKPKIDYLPGKGVHTCKFKGKTIYIVHEIEDTLLCGEDRIPTEQEVIKLMTWGFNV